MNNYIKGIASLLDLYATQASESDIKDQSGDDFSAIKSDWEKISEELKISIFEYISEISSSRDTFFVENLLKVFAEYRNDLNIINNILLELQMIPENLLIYKEEFLSNLQQNIISQKDLLEKINQQFIHESQNVREKESE